MTNDNQTTKRQPIDRVRVGRVTAAIWKNTSDEGKPFYGFTLDRSYKDKDGKYQSSDSFSLNDALVVAKVANIADTRIRTLLEADYAASRVADQYEEEAA